MHSRPALSEKANPALASMWRFQSGPAELPLGPGLSLPPALFQMAPSPFTEEPIHRSAYANSTEVSS